MTRWTVWRGTKVNRSERHAGQPLHWRVVQQAVEELNSDLEQPINQDAAVGRLIPAEAPDPYRTAASSSRLDHDAFAALTGPRGRLKESPDDFADDAQPPKGGA